MAGLPKLVGDSVHDGKGFVYEAFGGWVLLAEAKQAEGEKVAVLVGRLGKVASSFEAEQHAEDLGDGAVETSRHFTDGEAGGRAGEELQNVQTFFQRGSGIVSLGFGFSHDGH